MRPQNRFLKHSVKCTDSIQSVMERQHTELNIYSLEALLEVFNRPCLFSCMKLRPVPLKVTYQLLPSISSGR